MAVAHVRLADLSCLEGVATEEYMDAVTTLAMSLKNTGAVIVVLDSAAASAVDDVHVSAAAFFKQTAAAKMKHAAKSDACGATGYRQLSGKQVHDYALGDKSTDVPDLLACTAPRAYARLSAVGRTVLSALSWKLQAAAIEEQPAGFAGLCEPVPLRPQRNGASLLSLFSYDTGAGAAEAHVDRGLLTIVSSAGPGLELRTFANSWRGMQLHHGEVVVLAGATLAAASGQRLQAAVHRVGAQQFPRSSVVMRLRGSPDALLPRMSVAQFEQMFQESHPVSVNRNGGAAHGTRTSAGNDEGGSLKRRRSAPPVKVEQLPPPQAAPPPQLDDGSQISLRIRDQDGSGVMFRVKRNIKFSQIQAAYCSKKGLPEDGMRFLDGLRGGSYLLRNETPADVKMEDGDIILAIGFPLSSGRLLCWCRCDSVGD